MALRFGNLVTGVSFSFSVMNVKFHTQRHSRKFILHKCQQNYNLLTIALFAKDG